MKRNLESMKMHPREPFNDVLERLVEDGRKLDRRILPQVHEARLEIRAGRYLTQDQVRKAIGR